LDHVNFTVEEENENIKEFAKIKSLENMNVDEATNVSRLYIKSK